MNKLLLTIAMKEWLKNNWLSLTAILLAITAICLTIVRVDPINFNDGSTVTLVVGLMGVCATFMVASQIMGLRTSENKIKSMIKEESMELRKASTRTTIMALFRVEVTVISSIVEKEMWDAFVDKIKLLESYAIDLQDAKMANCISDILIKTETTFGFYQKLSQEKTDQLDKSILAIIKLVDSPKDLLKTFMAHL
uniref:hypothetical protein n=1 Tax=Bacteroides finegoldii TaxID=338188 RepID=UPI0035680BE2